MSGKNPIIQAPAGMFEDIAGRKHIACAPAVEAYEQIWKTAACSCAQVAQFLTKRVEEDMRLFNNLAACHHPGEAIESQLSFLETMVTDYAGLPYRLMSFDAWSPPPRRPRPAGKQKKSKGAARNG